MQGVFRDLADVATPATTPSQIDEMFKPKKSWWKRNAAPDLVALIINSPGGSPTQSNLLYKRIRAQSKATGIPVVAVVE